MPSNIPKNFVLLFNLMMKCCNTAGESHPACWIWLSFVSPFFVKAKKNCISSKKREAAFTAVDWVGLSYSISNVFVLPFAQSKRSPCSAITEKFFHLIK